MHVKCLRGVTCVDVMAAAMHRCSHQRESKQTEKKCSEGLSELLSRSLHLCRHFCTCASLCFLKYLKVVPDVFLYKCQQSTSAGFQRVSLDQLSSLKG